MKKCLLLGAAILLRTIAFSQPGHHFHERRLDGKDSYPNTLTVNFGAGLINDYPGAHIAVEYERYIRHDGRLSVSLPLSAFISGTVGTADYVETRHSISGAYLAPGVYYHPFGNNRVVDLSLGIMLAAGMYNDRSNYSNLYLDSTSTSVVRDALISVRGRVSLNLYPHHDHPVIGVFLEAGPMHPGGTYSSFSTQFGFKFGGRF